ncbi:hypothetical protein Nmel_011239, partial [Mimus melanotis]
GAHLPLIGAAQGGPARRGGRRSGDKAAPQPRNPVVFSHSPSVPTAATAEVAAAVPAAAAQPFRFRRERTVGWGGAGAPDGSNLCPWRRSEPGPAPPRQGSPALSRPRNPSGPLIGFAPLILGAVPARFPSGSSGSPARPSRSRRAVK